MNKTDVVKLMTESVTEMNRQMGKLNNIPDEELEPILKSHEEQLNVINANIYDVLVINKVIN